MVAALAGFDREDTPLPVVVDSPEVTSETPAPVAAQLRTVLSAPVQLTHRGTVFTIQPSEMVRLLQLPSGGESSLRIDQEAAARHFENPHGALLGPRNADFAVPANKGACRPRPARPRAERRGDRRRFCRPRRVRRTEAPWSWSPSSSRD